MTPRRQAVLVALAAALACGAAVLRQQPRQAAASDKLDVPALPDADDLGRRAFAHVRALVELGPRHPGSAARKKAANYLAARLRALGLEPIREAWTDPHEQVEFENVRVTLPGRSAKTLLLGTHYDTKLELKEPQPEGKPPFTGANDSGSGSGLLLALCEDLVHWKARGPTIEMVWFDGEESLEPAWNMDRALFGSREFVRRHLVEGHRYGALVLLDMVGHQELAIDRERSSSQELVAPFERAAKALGYERFFFQQTTEVDDDHVPFRKAGLPAIDLIQFEKNPTWHTYDDTLDNLSATSLGIVGRVVLRALPELEAGWLR